MSNSGQTENYPVREDPSPVTGLYLFIKRALYLVCRCLGLFALARRRARGKPPVPARSDGFD